MRFVVAALVLVTLVSCVTTINPPVPLFARGQPSEPVALLPSVSAPDPGFYPYAWAGLPMPYRIKGDAGKSRESDGTNSLGFLAGGGALRQFGSLREDWSAVPFIGADASYELAFVRTYYAQDTRGDEPALTSEQTSSLKQMYQSSALTGEARAGVLFKSPLGSVAVFGLGGARWESGDYLDFRRKIDGVGRLMNLSDQPLMPHWGGGAALDVGEPGSSAGLIVTVRFSRPQSQTAVQTVDENVDSFDEEWSIERREGGSVWSLFQPGVMAYWDRDHLRIALGLSADRPDFPLYPLTRFGANVAFAYRW